MEHGESQEASSTEGCQHRPQEGTLYTATGLKASLQRRGDFPVDAVCAVCGRPIRREHYEETGPGGEWKPKYPTPLERLAIFRDQHPEISISESGESVSWFDDDGPHTERFGSALRAADYLKARFGRPSR